MTQIHLRAEVGDYAPLVLLPGDPNRATRIAELLDGGLEQSRLVNDHRGMLGYTGTYQGQPVSVQTSGMGTPSISIVVEELLNLGAKRLVRVGTTGGIGPGVRAADLVVATSATPAGTRRNRGRRRAEQQIVITGCARRWRARRLGRPVRPGGRTALRELPVTTRTIPGPPRTADQAVPTTSRAMIGANQAPKARPVDAR